MTAHVLVPSLDEEKPATLSQRIVQGMLREELGFPGVILSDDLEMKAIAKSYTVPDAAGRRSRPVVMRCSYAAATWTCRRRRSRRWFVRSSRTWSLQASGRRAEARPRQRSGSLAAPVAHQSAGHASRVLGCDEHQRIVDEMSRFA